ncbi:uncharacterized protein LOC109860677 [Pseudomyrmex gracilis]|uniref:uncharacterized protein LOC109860677 n=1 Tax=Pseudomyrmex gracilis TaxID=219809 RepID=UPI000995CD55|nr:uncharacterized protein LOC109860677 [Pseudomyrmex gracilis]
MMHERVPTSFEVTGNNKYSLQLARWFLIPIGAWPQLSTATKTRKLLSHVHVLASSFFVAVIMVPCILYVTMEEKDNEIRLNTIGPLSHWIMGIIKYILLIAHGDNIRKCVRHMETDWRLVRKIEDQRVMLRYAKIGRYVTGFCAVFMQCGTLLFVVGKSLSTTIIVIGNETVSVHPMACQTIHSFVDTRYSPGNEIMAITHVLSCLVVNAIAVGACSLDAIFAIHAHGQLNVLFSWLRDLVSNDKKSNVEQQLAVVVEHHLRVLSFISRIESIMQHISLVELLGCTMNMCLLAYYFITNIETFDGAKTMSYVIVYVSITFNMFILCYIGELLTEQCKNVGEKAYMVNWYELPPKTALGFVLIIAQSNNVVKLTAGKFFHLSIATFGDVIKTSMVYLNMLRTMAPSATN